MQDQHKDYRIEGIKIYKWTTNCIDSRFADKSQSMLSQRTQEYELLFLKSKSCNALLTMQMYSNVIEWCKTKCKQQTNKPM